MENTAVARAAAGHPLAAPAAAAPTAATRWIISPAIDLIVFVFVTLLTIPCWIASDKLHVDGFTVLVFVALFNGPHLISTWTRVYLPARERFRRPVHYWIVPGVLCAFAVGCVAAGGLWPTWLRTVIFYWATWHFVAQAYGILRIYQRKQNAVDTLEAKLEKAILFGSCFFCVLRRIYTGPWELFGVQIWHPYPKAWMVNAFGALVVVIVLAYVAVALQRRPPLVRPLLVALTAFGFYMPFCVIKVGTSAFAAAALWHAVQYIGIVWHYNRTRYAGKRDPDARLISWVSQPGHTLGYVVMLAGCAAAVYGVALLLLPLVPWTLSDFSLALWTGLTLGHYYLDGKIWKFKQYDLNNLVAAAP